DLGPALFCGHDDGALEWGGGGERAIVVGLLERDLAEEVARDRALLEHPGLEDASVPGVGGADQLIEVACDLRAEASGEGCEILPGVGLLPEERDVEVERALVARDDEPAQRCHLPGEGVLDLRDEEACGVYRVGDLHADLARLAL